MQRRRGCPDRSRAETQEQLAVFKAIIVGAKQHPVLQAAGFKTALHFAAQHLMLSLIITGPALARQRAAIAAQPLPAAGQFGLGREALKVGLAVLAADQD